MDKNKIIIVPWLHPDHDARIYMPHIEHLRELGINVVLPTEGGLHWQTESAWLQGIDLVYKKMNIINQKPNQMLWSAHNE